MEALTKKNLIEIDGSSGEGGGQIFRTALTLAMCLQKNVRISNIRARRNKPGLLRQHLTCLRAAAEICNGSIEGGELGSAEVVFRPGAVRSGQYRFAIGSAGSTSLVFQTVLMPLLLSDGISEIKFEGGTHNGNSPSVDFIERSFLPLLKKMGCRVDTVFERYGFYPAGGGCWHATVYPVDRIDKVEILEPGALQAREAVAISARIPAHVTDRELLQVQRKCYWERSELTQKLVESAGPGNMLSLRLRHENIEELFESVGERSVSAERVAGRAIREMKHYLESGVPVAKHLADQLLLPMALGAGGRFRTLEPSEHFLTNMLVIQKMTDANIFVKKLSDVVFEISVGE